MYQTDVVVIGGGATGAGVLRDLSMRGFKALLIEKSDLSTGTSGRYHGLLHSGGRYAVKDPVSARECIEENMVLRRIATATIEDTGGFFVSTPDDDPAYADTFVKACRDAGIPVDEISVAEMIRREPLLNPRITRAFVVPDGSCEPWALVEANVASAREHGSDALTYHRVCGFERHNGRIQAVRVENQRTGDEVLIGCDFVVNAAGAWAGQIGTMAGAPIEMSPGKGSMIVMNHRLVQTVINRCHMPGDGDILVPVGSVCIIGTTEITVPDPDDYDIEPEEIDAMLVEGEKLIPGFAQTRSLRAYAGVRPLYSATDVAGDGRDISRTYAVLRHGERDGIENFVSIVGGKLTTYRLMAQSGADAVCEILGVDKTCRTAEEPLPGSENARYYSMAHRLAAVENDGGAENRLVCECEFVTRRQVEHTATTKATHDLGDIRRELRLGMGPCQGGFCTYRVAGVLHDLRHLPPHVTNRALLHFLDERWKGIKPVLWGDDLRQVKLDEEIFVNMLGVADLPIDDPVDSIESRS
ncbi:MAG: anaerobic glycerol-3-phosphate dehydrogenase subunit GlpA [Chloroflexota bacterium]